MCRQRCPSCVPDPVLSEAEGTLRPYVPASPTLPIISAFRRILKANPNSRAGGIGSCPPWNEGGRSPVTARPYDVVHGAARSFKKRLNSRESVRLRVSPLESDMDGYTLSRKPFVIKYGGMAYRGEGGHYR